jgi:hypothetical protein
VNISKGIGQYEVLSPWAEADPKPLRGITPRIAGLAGKKIGMFRIAKRAALPMMTVVERKLKERFSGLQFSDIQFLADRDINETEDKARFEEWVKTVDAVIASVGD